MDIEKIKTRNAQQAKVAIIGGGFAGCAAGVELAAAGISVTLFEAGKTLGGRARAVPINGVLLDNGQHMLIGAYHECLRLMEKVGITINDALQRQFLNIRFPAAKFHLQLANKPAPLHLAAGLLAARGLRLSDKMAAGNLVRVMHAQKERIPREMTVAELLQQHQQSANLRRFLWEPLCLSALNTPPAEASAYVFIQVLADTLGGARENTDYLLPKTNLSALFPNAAAKFIQENGGTIITETRIGDLAQLPQINETSFDAVILASAPQHAAKLLATQPKTVSLAAQMQALSYQPIATLYVAFPPETRLPQAMLGIDDGVNSMGQWVFDRGVFADQAGIFAFVLSAHGAWEILNGDELTTRLTKELEKVLMQKLPNPLWHQLITEERATFAALPNRFCPQVITEHPKLFLAGDYLTEKYPATLESAAKSGVLAAQKVTTYLKNNFHQIFW